MKPRLDKIRVEFRCQKCKNKEQAFIGVNKEKPKICDYCKEVLNKERVNKKYHENKKLKK